MDVGEHSTLRDGDTAQELVEFLVVPDGELDVARYDAGALVVLGGVSGELEKLGGEVLEYRGHVDRSSRADTFGESSLGRAKAVVLTNFTVPSNPLRSAAAFWAARMASMLAPAF